MGILKKIRDKTGTVHDLGDSRVDAFETELSGAARNVPYSPAVLGKANAIEKKIDDHASNVANPHGVTKEQLGLANVENKSSTQIRSEITKENVTNALGYTPIDESRIGAANGVASLDAGGRIPASQIPGGFDNIEEYDSLSDFPETGEEGKIYVAKDTNLTYRWTGSQYVEISPSLALGETATTAYRGDRGKAAYDHSQISGDSTIHHVHANKELLDSYTQTEADLANAVAKVHEHGNKTVLDGITADKVTAWDGKQDKLAAGRDIEITSSNAINSRSNAWVNIKFNGITTTADEAIVIATLAYGSMATTRIITTDLSSSYAWGLDITVHVTNSGACKVLYTNRTSHKDALVVGRKDSRIYICIKGNLASSAEHNIVTVFTSTFLETIKPSTAYTKVSIADLASTNITVDMLATERSLEAKQDAIPCVELKVGDDFNAVVHSKAVELGSSYLFYVKAKDSNVAAGITNGPPGVNNSFRAECFTFWNGVAGDSYKSILVQVVDASSQKLLVGKIIQSSSYPNTTAFWTEKQNKLAKTDAEITDAVDKAHSHGNKAVLDGITAEKVTAWDSKQQALAFDDAPTAGSTNPVTSGGIKTALDAESTARSDADTALGGRIDTVDARGLTVKEIDGEQVLCFE